MRTPPRPISADAQPAVSPDWWAASSACPCMASASAGCRCSRWRNRVTARRVVWVGQPWVAVWEAIATRLGRSASSQAAAVSGSLRSGAGVPRWRMRGRRVALGRVEGVHRRGGGGEGEVEQARQRGPAHRRGVLVEAAAAGIGADQVVEGVPAGAVLLEKMVVGQVVEMVLDGAEVGAGQGRGGVGVDVRTRVQRRESQQSLPIGGQVPVRHVEGGFHAGVQAPVAAAFVEPVGVVGQGPAGPPAMCAATSPRASGRCPQRSAIRAAASGSPPGCGTGAAETDTASPPPG